ncbi:MAG TPA: Ig-like domain-containing protein, partial [Methanocella sp.]|nr:Ig-like domain-containing protein [Methanocella sp.]
MPVNAYAASPAYNLTVIASANATAGSPSGITVHLDNGGTPVAGAAVSLSVSGGSISPASVTTNASGYATAIFSAPTTAGTVTLTASNANSPTVNQPIQVIGGRPASMMISSANSTLMRANTGNAFIYKVSLNDTYGNPCGSASVNVTVDGSLSTMITAQDGTVTSSLGPTSSSHTYNVTVNSAN